MLRVLLVHYHAAALARAAVESLALGLHRAPDVVLVDNGSTPEERRLLSELPVRLLEPGRNLGYAAALNLGVQASPEAQAFLALNPDVRLAGHDLVRLGSALATVDAVGPRFWWDSRKTALLPPGELRRPLDELLAALARAPGPLRRLARRRWRRHALRHHEATDPVPSWSLSGAALAFRREAWERTGGFDEGYRLYFEESDWLSRLRATGGSSLHLPSAQAVHHWGASSRGEPRAASWFEDSCRRFRARHYGPATARLLALLERRPVETEAPFGPDRVTGASWLELAVSPAGFPAASIPLRGDEPVPLTLPEPLHPVVPAGRLWLRAVGPEGRELALRSVLREPGAPPP